MGTELAMKHEETPGVDCPVDEVGMPEHIDEVGIEGRCWRYGQDGMERNDECHEA